MTNWAMTGPLKKVSRHHILWPLKLSCFICTVKYVGNTIRALLTYSHCCCTFQFWQKVEIVQGCKSHFLKLFKLWSHFLICFAYYFYIIKQVPIYFICLQQCCFAVTCFFLQKCLVSHTKLLPDFPSAWGESFGSLLKSLTRFPNKSI